MSSCMQRCSTDDFSHLREVFLGPVEKAFDHFFDEFWGAPKVVGYVKSNLHYPKMDIGFQGEEFVIRAAVPGVSSDGLKVEELPDKIVRISGEMSEEHKAEEKGLVIKELCKRRFAREVQLPENTVNESPQATLKDGILTLRWKVATKNQKPPPKLINIKTE